MAGTIHEKTSQAPIPHPLHPVTQSEIERGVKILKESDQLTDRIAFSSGNLVEPAKDVVKTFAPGDPISRVLRFLGVDEHSDEHANGSQTASFDACVNVSSGELLEIRRNSGAQAPFANRHSTEDKADKPTSD